MRKLHFNSLCLSLGHQWENTTADNYRQCTRERCEAVERLENDTWIMASTPSPTRTRSRKAPRPAPVTLWESSGYCARDFFTADSATLQFAEQRYHRLLGR